MKISNQLKEYVKESIKVSKSNLIITDLEQVKLIEFFDSFSKREVTNYSLSNKAKELLKKWNSFVNENSFCVVNGIDCIPILKNDNNVYTCQMIFPIVINNATEGLLILYRNSGNYVLSSIKSVENFKQFVIEFIKDSINIEKKGE